MNTHYFQIGLPPRGIPPNARVHYRKRAEATALYRTEGYIAARAIVGSPKVVRVSWTFCLKGVRIETRRLTMLGQQPHLLPYAPFDDDNALASVKPARDGIAQALGISDAARTWQTGTITIDRTRGPYVQVVIEELA